MSRYHRRQAGAEDYRRQQWLIQQPASVQFRDLCCRWGCLMVMPAGLIGLLLWAIPALRIHVLSFWPGFVLFGSLILGLLWFLKSWQP
jgi:hypothetical protein